MKSKIQISKATLCVAFLVLSAPCAVQAAVIVSEIAYDVPGGDSGHEWIEAYNNGSSGVDLAASDFRFFNREGGHKVLSYEGNSTVLGPGAAVVIADNPAIFLSDHPGFSGIVLDSSFSLTAADTIGFRLSDGSVQDSVSYDSSMGAAGDGMTLHRSGNSLVVGPQSPGVYGSSGVPEDNPSQATSDGQSAESTTTVSHGGALPPKMEADAGGNRTVEAGAGSFYEGHVYNASGVSLSNGRFVWNFGNGDTAEGQSVFYAYQYPGKYAVVMTADAGNGFSTQDTIEVEVVRTEITLTAGSDGSITITNASKTGEKLDLSLWLLSRGGGIFSIPRGTLILPRSGVKFSPATLGLPLGDLVQLYYPSGAEAARAYLSSNPVREGIEYIPAAGVSSPSVSARAPSVASTPSAGALKGAANESFPEPQVGETIGDTQAAAALLSSEEGSFPWWYFVLGLISIILIGIVAAVYASPGPLLHLDEDEDGQPGEEQEDPYAEADKEAEGFTIETRK